MKHYSDTSSYSADDIEKALDRLALAIKANGPDGRKLLPLYAALEAELDALRAADETMQKVLARLSR